VIEDQAVRRAAAAVVADHAKHARRCAISHPRLLAAKALPRVLRRIWRMQRLSSVYFARAWNTAYRFALTPGQGTKIAPKATSG
jgi:hypothetical protein